MKEIISKIEKIRGKLEDFRGRNMKETPTRTIIINPLLESMGWDVRDPDEVELEYPTVDGKSVDYALKINGDVVLLVEAKALDDSLTDVKAITQVVGYASNNGIEWCVLTNGILWKVYRSMEKCAAPEKLMYEVSLDPRDSEDMPIEDLARKLFRFSRDGMEKGILDELGEQTFTDGKVRKALDSIIMDPQSNFVRIIKKEIGDQNLKPPKIKESLARIWAEKGVTTFGKTKVKPSRTKKHKKEKQDYDDSYHTENKPKEILEIFRAIDRYCLSLKPEKIEKRFNKYYIAYYSKKMFCHVVIRKGSVVVRLRTKYSRLERPPSFVRDISNIKKWGSIELKLNALSQLDQAKSLIHQAFDSQDN